MQIPTQGLWFLSAEEAAAKSTGTKFLIRYKGRRGTGYALVELSDGRFLVCGIHRMWGTRYYTADSLTAYKSTSEILAVHGLARRAQTSGVAA